jgi:hypothetical protein
VKYTLLIVSKRTSIPPQRAPRLNAFLGIRDAVRTPELWDITQSHECSTPKQLATFLRNNNLFFRGLPYGDSLKVEIHEHNGKFSRVDWKRPPMIIKSIIPEGSRAYRPCVHFPSGKIQDLTKFLASWKLTASRTNRIVQYAYVTD